MIKLAIVGALAGLALVVGLLATLIVLVASRPALAQTPDPAPAGPMVQGAPTHEPMHQMMDAMHGEGASQRMHEAMGPDAEKMMDQCANMMTKEMMDQCAAMMPGSGTGMMGGQNRDSMRDMMRRMMPQSGL
jgi:hypothetical protein